ncbi:MAG: virulence protein [Dysgonamonadaceae bacterium]|jgi:virulence-associated protein VapD|nr:virulence protein [Dysgonamonadaceae bacterium]
MFAIAFDMIISDLEKYYGIPYHKAYYEIREILKKHSFEWIQGSTYMTASNDMSVVFNAIMDLSDIDWFARSVRDVRGFKVENWSNFTNSVKRRIQ